MDREQLLNLLNSLKDDELAVKPDGTVRAMDTDDEYTPEDVEAAVAELTDELSDLLEWVKAAPQYQPAKATA